MADFNLKVMLTGFGAYFYLLELKRALFFLGFLFLFCLFIPITAIIHYFADRRVCIR